MRSCKAMIKPLLKKQKPCSKNPGTWSLKWEIGLWRRIFALWPELAGNGERLYACYDEDLNAEFIHIKGGVCLWVYQAYDGEVDTDEGENQEISVLEWADVAAYIDRRVS